MRSEQEIRDRLQYAVQHGEAIFEGALEWVLKGDVQAAQADALKRLEALEKRLEAIDLGQGIEDRLTVLERFIRYIPASLPERLLRIEKNLWPMKGDEPHYEDPFTRRFTKEQVDHIFDTPPCQPEDNALTEATYRLTARLLSERRKGREEAAEVVKDLQDQIEALLAVAPRWIPVEERLPEPETLVLLTYVGELDKQFPSVTLGYRVRPESSDRLTWRTKWELHFEYTHWMPLPPKPEVE